MNPEKDRDWKRATIVAKSLADTKDQRVLLALTFALKEPIGKSYSRDEVLRWILCQLSDEQKEDFRVRADLFQEEVRREEGEKLTEDEQKAWEFECFLRRKYQRKIDKRVADFKDHLEEKHD